MIFLCQVSYMYHNFDLFNVTNIQEALFAQYLLVPLITKGIGTFGV